MSVTGPTQTQSYCRAGGGDYNAAEDSCEMLTSQHESACDSIGGELNENADGTVTCEAPELLPTIVVQGDPNAEAATAYTASNGEEVYYTQSEVNEICGEAEMCWDMIPGTDATVELR